MARQLIVQLVDKSQVVTQDEGIFSQCQQDSIEGPETLFVQAILGSQLGIHTTRVNTSTPETSIS
jgi:hypothetical protein